MTEIQTKFRFNSAITAVDPDTGIFHEEAHKAAILPVRAALMQIDGVIGCHIWRYGVTVNHLETVISDEELEQAVKEAVERFASDDNLFPLRDGKKIVVTRDTPPKSFERTVFVRFNSHILAFHALDGANMWDKQAFMQHVQPLKDKLAEFDGLLSLELHPGSASMTIDTRITSPEETEDHMRRVLKSAFHTSPFFPFLKEAELLELTFTHS